ncbi:prepilin-type N-terminal cleavage/methylation domain-containing protein [Parahaliea mediterranea]|uniref:Prepilin-type N-terminal cleavage/methylation domain-containing protein n=1 Tax=Parahaliea mediterranea TaxID=651086 RepID=A0A939IIE7_9GAMM|nr:prepilin-type N-terminal cleavage/methylation domain-containing protein [Parahaliea mediterranea]
MSCRTPARSTQRAFTLVEVMVALAVLSLIMLATVTAMRTLANTQRTLDASVSRIDEVRTVTSFIRDQLEVATLGSNSSGLSLGAGANEGAYFRGYSNSMEWKATIKFGESYGGQYLLRIVRNDDTLWLQWREMPQVTAEIDWSGAQSRRLIDGVQDFRLAYRATHVDPWEGAAEQGVVPALVRLRIKTRERYWPDLIMAVPR